MDGLETASNGENMFAESSPGTRPLFLGFTCTLNRTAPNVDGPFLTCLTVHLEGSRGKKCRYNHQQLPQHRSSLAKVQLLSIHIHIMIPVTGMGNYIKPEDTMRVAFSGSRVGS